MRQIRLYLGIMKAKRFHHETGETERKQQPKQPPVTRIVTQASRPSKGAAIHGQQTTDDECHAEYVHRQFIDEVVPAVVKVVWPIVGDRQQRGADRQHNEATEEKQVEERAERLAMNTFLRHRILEEPPTPHTPVTLKSAPLTFPPKPNASRDLPHEHGDTRRDHNEEHHAHPRRDVAEYFARSVIYIRHRILAQARRIDSMSCGTI